ncbi:hypothetical protein N7454_005703 [Penicillium verhagenii]|nr:hypothetical protein N7454_005703 [Penicillium verhagenii]
MEVDQSSKIKSTVDGANKKKTSRKSHNTEPTSSAPEPTDLTSSALKNDQSPREKKRKRNLESGDNKQKKHKHRSTENVVGNGDASLYLAEEQQAQAQPDEPAAPAKEPSKLIANSIETPTQEADAINPTSTGKTKKIRGSRLGGKNNMKVGFFVKEEVEILESFKVNFCNIHGFTDHKKFDEMIQHSEREGGDWPCPADVCTKTEFWNQIYELVPDRDRRSLYRFMRRHFQDSTQKPHEWSEEQDKELVSLMTQHPGKWAYVAKLVGRSDDDVTQRWKNQLEHREKMNRGKWSEEELRSLLDEIQKVWHTVYDMEGDAAGKDMYELAEKHLRWGVVSDALGNVRSRQQCADKWRKMRRSVDIRRASGEHDAVFDPVEAANKRTRWGSTSVTPKSSFFVNDDDDDDEDENDADTKGDKESSGPINGLGIFANIPSLSAPETKPLPKTPASSQQNSEQAVQAKDEQDEAHSPATSKPKSAKKLSSKKQKHPHVEETAEPEPEPLPELENDSEPETQLSPDAIAKAERRAERKMLKKAEKEKKKKERRERDEAENIVDETQETAAAIDDSPKREKKKEKKDKKDKKKTKSLLAAAGTEAEVEAVESTPTSSKKKRKHKSTDVNGADTETHAPTDFQKKKRRKSTHGVAE